MPCNGLIIDFVGEIVVFVDQQIQPVGRFADYGQQIPQGRQGIFFVKLDRLRQMRPVALIEGADFVIEMLVQSPVNRGMVPLGSTTEKLSLRMK